MVRLARNAFVIDMSEYLLETSHSRDHRHAGPVLRTDFTRAPLSPIGDGREETNPSGFVEPLQPTCVVQVRREGAS
jgi:hypothetical protein